MVLKTCMEYFVNLVSIELDHPWWTWIHSVHFDDVGDLQRIRYSLFDVLWKLHIDWVGGRDENLQNRYHQVHHTECVESYRFQVQGVVCCSGRNLEGTPWIITIFSSFRRAGCTSLWEVIWVDPSRRVSRAPHRMRGSYGTISFWRSWGSHKCPHFGAMRWYK